jgi:hypothetical protein
MAARPPPRLGPVGPVRGPDRRNPFRPDEQPEDDLGPMGHAGRGLPGGAPRSLPSGQAPPSHPQQPGGASPFAAYAPDSRIMNAHAEQARSQSFGLVAIVGGLVFMVGAAVVITLVVVIALFFVRDELGEVIAGKGDKDPKHVTDTGFVREIEQPQPGRGPRVADPVDPDDPNRVRDPRLGPPPGPATIIVSTSMFFHTIEVDCPGGYRNRGKFRKDAGGQTMRATVPNVPGDEKCTVTFQGSEPAKTYVSGNQTKQCTFNPTQCHDVW